MLIASLFIIPPYWGNEYIYIYISGERIKKLQYIVYTMMEDYSSIKRKKLLIDTSWMNLKGIMLSKRS